MFWYLPLLLSAVIRANRATTGEGVSMPRPPISAKTQGHDSDNIRGGAGGLVPPIPMAHPTSFMGARPSPRTTAAPKMTITRFAVFSTVKGVGNSVLQEAEMPEPPARSLCTV